MYASNSHSYTYLILALGIVREPTVWVFIISKYPGTHDIGLPTVWRVCDCVQAAPSGDSHSKYVKMATFKLRGEAKKLGVDISGTPEELRERLVALVYAWLRRAPWHDSDDTRSAAPGGRARRGGDEDHLEGGQGPHVLHGVPQEGAGAVVHHEGGGAHEAPTVCAITYYYACTTMCEESDTEDQPRTRSLPVAALRCQILTPGIPGPVSQTESQCVSSPRAG